MFQKGLSSAVFLCVIFMNTTWNTAAQTPQDIYARGMQAARQEADRNEKHRKRR